MIETLYMICIRTTYIRLDSYSNLRIVRYVYNKEILFYGLRQFHSDNMYIHRSLFCY